MKDSTFKFALGAVIAVPYLVVLFTQPAIASGFYLVGAFFACVATWMYAMRSANARGRWRKVR